jgi:hypothetical protein
MLAQNKTCSEFVYLKGLKAKANFKSNRCAHATRTHPQRSPKNPGEAFHETNLSEEGRNSGYCAKNSMSCLDYRENG